MERMWAMMPFVALVFVLVGAYVFVRRRHPRPAQSGGGDIRCPHCGSTEWERDSASPWIFIGACLLFPFSLVLFCLNGNVWCTACGTRFKRPGTPVLVRRRRPPLA